MNDEIPLSKDDSSKDESNFVEMLKNKPNPAGESQIYEAFKKGTNTENPEESSLTYNEMLDLIYPTEKTRILDGFRIHEVLPKINWLQGVGKNLETIPECYEVYKLKLPEFEAYEKEREQKRLRGLQRVGELWNTKIN